MSYKTLALFPQDTCYVACLIAVFFRPESSKTTLWTGLPVLMLICHLYSLHLIAWVCWPECTPTLHAGWVFFKACLNDSKIGPWNLANTPTELAMCHCSTTVDLFFGRGKRCTNEARNSTMFAMGFLETVPGSPGIILHPMICGSHMFVSCACLGPGKSGDLSRQGCSPRPTSPNCCAVAAALPATQISKNSWLRWVPWPGCTVLVETHGL